MKITIKQIELAKNNNEVKKRLLKYSSKKLISERFFHVILFNIADDPYEFITKIDISIISQYASLLKICAIKNNDKIFNYLLDNINVGNQTAFYETDNLKIVKSFFEKVFNAEKKAGKFLQQAIVKNNLDIIDFISKIFPRNISCKLTIIRILENFDHHIISYEAHLILLKNYFYAYVSVLPYKISLVFQNSSKVFNPFFINVGNNYFYDKRIYDIFVEKGLSNKINIFKIFNNLDIDHVRNFVTTNINVHNFEAFINIFLKYPEIDIPKKIFADYLVNFGRKAFAYINSIIEKMNNNIPFRIYFDFNFLQKIPYLKDRFTEDEYDAIEGVRICILNIYYVKLEIEEWQRSQ